MQYDIQSDVHQSHNGGCDAFSSFLHSIVFSCNLSSGIYGTYPILSTFYPRMIFYPLGNANKILNNMAISILRLCIY